MTVTNCVEIDTEALGCPVLAPCVGVCEIWAGAVICVSKCEWRTFEDALPMEVVTWEVPAGAAVVRVLPGGDEADVRVATVLSVPELDASTADGVVVIVSNTDESSVRVKTGDMVPEIEERSVIVSTGVRTSVAESRGENDDNGPVVDAGISDVAAELHGTDTVTIDCPIIETLEHYSWVTAETMAPAATVASLIRLLT